MILALIRVAFLAVVVVVLLAVVDLAPEQVQARVGQLVIPLAAGGKALGLGLLDAARDGLAAAWENRPR